MCARTSPTSPARPRVSRLYASREQAVRVCPHAPTPSRPSLRPVVASRNGDRDPHKPVPPESGPCASITDLECLRTRIGFGPSEYCTSLQWYTVPAQSWCVSQTQKSLPGLIIWRVQPRWLSRYFPPAVGTRAVVPCVYYGSNRTLTAPHARSPALRRLSPITLKRWWDGLERVYDVSNLHWAVAGSRAFDC